MKKTLVALAVTAFAASSASAVTVYDNEGTKVQFDGSLRLALEKVKSDSDRTSTSKLRNDGTRFGLRVNHDLGDGLYALGRFELRFNQNSNTDGFGTIYAHRAYVGLGHKQAGELTFGRQVTIGDDVAQGDHGYIYSYLPSTVQTSGKSVVRYDYKAIEGLQLGASYSFTEKRDGDSDVSNESLKNGTEVGGVYEFAVGQDKATIAAAYSRLHYGVTTTDAKHRADAWAIGTSYATGPVEFALDGGQKFDKQNGKTERTSFVMPAIKFHVTDKNDVYANYAYKHVRNNDHVNGAKARSHGFVVGTDYKLHKQVIVYAEGAYQKTKAQSVAHGEYAKSTDKAIGVGMRVYW